MSDERSIDRIPLHLPEGALAVPSTPPTAEEKAVANAFYDTIRRELEKRQPKKPEPPTIDV